MTVKVRVAICVATFRRPDGLGRLLESLVALSTPDGIVLDVIPVVVDNDPQGSAGQVARQMADTFEDFVYVVEPKVGISAARNRLVMTALALEPPPQYLAFVDDDEWVDPKWLACLVGEAVAKSRDVVAGPVVSAYDDAIAPWLRAGGYFERPRRETGTQIEFAGTGNLLIRATCFESLFSTEPFGSTFVRAGGEDTFLSMQFRRAGVPIYWCDEAIVHEAVAPTRATARWVVRREFNGAYDFSRCLTMVSGTYARLARRSVLSVGRLCLGLLLVLPGLLRGRRAALDAVRMAAGGLGGIVGLLDRAVYALRRH